MQVITSSTPTTRDVVLGAANKTTILSLVGCTFSDGLQTKTISGLQTVTLKFTPPATTFGSTLAEVYADGVRVLEYQVVDAGVKQYDPERLRYGISRAHPKDVDLTKGIRLLGLGAVDGQGYMAGLAAPTLTQDITNSPRADTRTEYGHYIRGAYLDKITNRVYFLSISTLLPTVYYEDFGSDAVVHMQTFPYDNYQYDDRYLVTFHASGLVRVYDYTLKKVIQSVQLPYKLRDGSTPNISLSPMLTIDTEGVMRVHNHATSAVYAAAYGTLWNHKQPYYYENRSVDFIRTSIHDGGTLAWFSGNQYSFLVLSAEARQNAFEVLVSGTQNITSTRVSYSGSDQVQFIEIHRNTENSVHTNWVLAAYDFAANTCVNVTFAGAPAYYSKTQPMGALGGFWSTGHWENPPNWSYSINSSGGIDVLAVRNSVPYKVGTLPDRFLMEYVLYTSPSYRAYGRTLKSGPMSFIVDGSSAGVVLPDSIPMVSESPSTSSATFTLPANSPSGLLISVPSSLPCTILVNGAESRYAGPNDVIKLVFTNRSKITQPTYSVTVGRSVTTLFPDTTPNAFTIANLYGCALGEEHTTETVTPTGFDNATISGGVAALVNGVRTNLPATVVEGDSVAFVFKQTQIEQNNTVFIGTVSYTFTSFRDRPAVLTPVSLFHVVYARSGVKYTSGLIRNDTGQAVEIAVVNGAIVGGKTTLADQETCELEFVAPKQASHNTVLLTSGAASVAWHIWRDSNYLDLWETTTAESGTKAESLPLSFASLPKPAKMNVYFPSGIDAKVNGVDININETDKGLDADSTELEITTDDEVIISGYPNFAPKRIRVGSVYATWLVYPTGGDPNGEVPYYASAFLPDSVPVRLRSMSYSTSSSLAVDRYNQSPASKIALSSNASSETVYVSASEALHRTQAVHEAQGLDPLVNLASEYLVVCNTAEAVHSNAHPVEAGISAHATEFLARLPVGVFQYRHQNCELSEAPETLAIAQNNVLTSAATGAYAGKDTKYLSALSPVRVSGHAEAVGLGLFVNANRLVITHETAEAENQPDSVASAALPGATIAGSTSYFSAILACNYGVEFHGTTLDASVFEVSWYSVESKATRQETPYSHSARLLEIVFVKAESLYRIPVRPQLISDSWYRQSSNPLYGTEIAYTPKGPTSMLSTEEVYVLPMNATLTSEVRQQVPSRALHVEPASNSFELEACLIASEYSVVGLVANRAATHTEAVASRSKLISNDSNQAKAAPISASNQTHSVQLSANNFAAVLTANVLMAACRTQDNHSVYAPEYLVFESFYSDESALDVPHGYFETNVNALNDGMSRWQKMPYEIAPYELQPSVWVWMTPVYGFDLCSAVNISGYIRGG